MKPGKDFIGIGVFVLVFDENGKIMLVDHKPSSKKSAKFADKWSMPGGSIEFGEISTEAIKRELKEELDLDIFDIKFLNYYDSIESDRHWVALNFTAKTKQIPRNLEPHKIRDIKFFDASEIPVNISEDTGRCLTQLGYI